MQESLEGAKAEMVKDLQSKRHALRLERSSLLFDAFHGKDRACALPPVVNNNSGSRGGAETPTGMAAAHVQELLMRTQKLDRHAEDFCQSVYKLLGGTKLSLERLRAKTSCAMKKRINETLALKKQLQAEVSESQMTITRTEMSLDMLRQEIATDKQHLDNMDPTADVSLTSFDQRLPPLILVKMREDAMARNQDHYDKLSEKVKAMEEKLASVQKTFDKLVATHEELAANLESKTQAWNVDVACSKVQPKHGPSGGDSGRCSASSAAPPPAPYPRPSPPRGPAGNGSGVPRRLPPHLPPLDEATLDFIRARIKAASYTGKAREMDVIFTKFDKDGFGQLEENEIRLAIRRALKIPPTVISDEQIASLCMLVDADGSGAISISEFCAFVSDDKEEYISQRTGRSLLKLNTFEGGSPEEFAASIEVMSSRTQNSTSLTARSAPTPRRPRAPPLKPHVIDSLRSRIKAASYAGHLGREVEAIFNRVDKDGSGQLEGEEIRQVLRRVLRVPPSVISDAEINVLVKMLDADNTGTVSIAELVDFVGKEPTNSKRTGKTVGPGAVLAQAGGPVPA